MKRLVVLLLACHSLLGVSRGQGLYIQSISGTTSSETRATIRFFGADDKSIVPDTSTMQIRDEGQLYRPTSMSCSVRSGDSLHIIIATYFYAGVPDITPVVELVSTLNYGNMDVAVVSHQFQNILRTDFTRDRQSVIDAVNASDVQSSAVSFDELFFAPGGVMEIANRVSGRKIVVLVGNVSLDQGITDVPRILTEARSTGLEIVPYPLGQYIDTRGFRLIADSTSGTLLTLPMYDIQRREPEHFASHVYGSCTVSWTPAPFCQPNRDVFIATNGFTAGESYTTAIPMTEDWSHTPPYVVTTSRSAGTLLDTTIIIRSLRRDLSIVGIDTDPSSISATISSQVIRAGDSAELRVRWLKTSNEQELGVINVRSNACTDRRITITVPGTSRRGSMRPIIDAPNGGETFTTGSPASIMYHGVPSEQEVDASISTDGGATWISVGKGRNGRVDFTTPLVTSDSCLARITTVDNGSLSLVDSASVLGGSWLRYWSIDHAGRWLFIAKADTVDQYDASTLQRVARIPTTGRHIWSVTSDRSGEYAAVLRDDHSIQIIDGMTHTVRRLIRVNDMMVGGDYRVFTTSNGRFLIARGGFDRRHVLMIDTTGETIHQLILPDRPIMFDAACEHVAWTDGTRVVVQRLVDGSSWSIDRRSISNTQFGLISFSPDDRYLVVGEEAIPATGQARRWLQLWRMSDRSRVWTMNHYDSVPSANRRHSYSTAYWDRDGTSLIAMGEGCARIDLRDGHVRMSLDSVGDQRFGQSARTLDERYLAIMTDSASTVQVYDLVGNSIRAQMRIPIAYILGDQHFRWVNDRCLLVPGVSSTHNVRLYYLDQGTGAVVSDISDTLWRIVAPPIAVRIDTIDMGTLYLGQRRDSLVQDVLCNDGARRSTVRSLQAVPTVSTELSLRYDVTRAVLDAGTCLAMNASFVPADTGVRWARFMVVTSNGVIPDTIVMFGRCLPDPDRRIIDTIDFGSVIVGAFRDTIDARLLRNIGTRAVSLTSASIRGIDASAFSMRSTIAPATLAPSDSASGDLRFTPSADRPFQAVLEFQHDGPISPSMIVLRGRGVSSALQFIGPDSLTTSCTGMTDTTIQIVNRSSRPLIISAIAFVGAPSFTLMGAPSSATLLQPDSVVRLRWRFTPTQAGVDTAVLRISYTTDGVLSTTEHRLIGIATFPTFRTSVTSIEVGPLPPATVVESIVWLRSDLTEASSIMISTEGSGVSLVGPAFRAIGTGPRSLRIQLQCTVPVFGTTQAALVISSPLCAGTMSVPITLTSTRTVPPDTVEIRVRDILGSVGDSVDLTVDAIIPPTAIAVLGPSMPIDLTWNGSLAVPIELPPSTFLRIEGYDLTAMTRAFTDPSRSEYSLRIPSRLTLGVDSTSVVGISTPVTDPTIVYRLIPGSILVKGLCTDQAVFRGFDAAAKAKVSMRRMPGVIQCLIPLRAPATTSVHVMDMRGATVQRCETTRRDEATVEANVELAALARGAYVIIIDRNGWVTSIPFLR